MKDLAYHVGDGIGTGINDLIDLYPCCIWRDLRIMLKRQTIVVIDESFRSLIKEHNYEKYLHTIINKSQLVFRGLKFKHIDNQAHGESDFIDSNGKKYDAKLLFDKKQGALIGDSKNEFEKWLREMQDEKTEFGECIRKRNLSIIDDTKLYKIMKARLASVKPDENAIMFIPFPIVDEYKNSVFLQLATDFLQAVYDKLEDDKLVGNRKLYFIYPSGEPQEYVLRNTDHMREYICCEELEDFISFES